MRKAVLALTLVPFLFCLPISGEAQRVYRIGALVAVDQFVSAFDGFKEKMAALGYVEGKNIEYHLHNAKGDRDLLQKLAEKLVQERPDVIVTATTAATVPVAKASAGTNLPVVFLAAGNPLEFVKSYSSSGNNLTGISTSAFDLTGKRMELLKELAPSTKRVITLNTPAAPTYKTNLKATREAAKMLSLELVEVDVQTVEEIKQKLPFLVNKQLGDAVFVSPFFPIYAAMKEIARQAVKEKLPSVTTNAENVHEGVLAAYGPDYYALGQQGAVLVDKILKGASPSDLPIELPYKLHLVINLKTARAIGLKIPREILLRADEVIE